MLVIVNPTSAGGTGRKKWDRIEPDVRAMLGAFELAILDDPQEVRERVAARLEAGETRFVAAGGDGTVNLVAAALVEHLPDLDLRPVWLGAIGLGSSNDFHKPVDRRHRMTGIPFRLDFEHGARHDMGIVTYRDESGRLGRRSWLINASIGTTAEANGFFNRPDALLRILKKRFPRLAIVYAAVHEILRNRSRTLLVSVDGAHAEPRRVSNLGVVKNPHFTGGLRYDSPHEPGSGCFYIHMLADVSLPRLLLALAGLARGRFAGRRGAFSRRAHRLEVRAEEPFALEGDGEVVFASEASFCLIPRLLRVCA